MNKPGERENSLLLRLVHGHVRGWNGYCSSVSISYVGSIMSLWLLNSSINLKDKEVKGKEKEVIAIIEEQGVGA